MSIDFERSSGVSIQRSGFIHRMSPFVGMCNGDRGFPTVERRREEDLEDSSSSSSIGRNSDASSGEVTGDDCEESEVQSSFKGPLDTMDALEEVLPVKRGISKFYNGKSKSFTSLADASSASSVKDFAKPENTYSRKRKNLLARNNFLDKKCNQTTKDNASGKKPANFNRSTAALGTNCYKSNEKRGDSYTTSSSPSSGLPPLHPHGKTSLGNGSCLPPAHWNSHWRSFSLSDLQSAAAASNF
ncbi:hypothetical protein JCGZ_07485 [Jatropha curcas]|uniref:Uncharacterized protein n=2 Tax=Jatropha curcas TaxID=180498 RepID=A0A067KQ12_JATCU|nr:hypothetical protein JCGZ_07485 [Jatropha curcas]